MPAEDRARDDFSLSDSASYDDDLEPYGDSLSARSRSPTEACRKRSPEARDGDSGKEKVISEAHGSGSAGGEDPLGAFFSSRTGSRSPAKALAKDDPMADFFSDRPRLKEIEDPEEALRARQKRSNAVRSPPKDQTRQPRREEAPARGRDRRGDDRGTGRSRSRHARGAQYDRTDRGDRADRAVRTDKGARHTESDRKQGGGRRKLDEFVQTNELSEDVAARLYKLDKHEIATVLEQGFDLGSTRNPNAVVISRIKKLGRDTGEDTRPPKGSGRSREEPVGSGRSSRHEAVGSGRSRGEAARERGGRGERDRGEHREHRERTRGHERGSMNGSAGGRRSPARRAEQKGRSSGRTRPAEAGEERRTRRRH